MSDLVIRALSGPAEYRACVALQKATWGEAFGELVPPSLLMVSQEMGGIASGAFDGNRLAGFVFGVSGLRDGRPAHWSDMLAVDPAYRGRGLGRALKLHQREYLLQLGIERVLWTFDPLVARNAYLNLTRLGATATVYRRDAYGPSDSPLHAGIGTDRLLADWALRSARVEARVAGSGAAEDLPGGADALPWVLPAEAGGAWPRPGPFRPQPEAEAVRVAVPPDIEALKADDPSLARTWRARTREALEWGFENGFTATALIPGPGDAAAYVLSRGF